MFWLMRQLANLLFLGLMLFLLYSQRQAILAALGTDEATVRQAIEAKLTELGVPHPPLLEEPLIESPPGAQRTLTVRADRSGHFMLTASVDGKPVRFLVDTGASSVVLTPEDAARIGIRPKPREFTQFYRTANGMVRAAPVTLREVQIGALTVRDVDAVVNERPIGVSLLGVSFLRRLDSYTVQNNRLVLSW
jgi:aspartyl protease family protein